jgi:hypothetical protein
MSEPSEYEIKTEDLKANKLEQDRLTNVLIALTSVIPYLVSSDSDLHALSREHLYHRTAKFLELLKDEDLLLSRLEELRAKKEF